MPGPTRNRRRNKDVTIAEADCQYDVQSRIRATGDQRTDYDQITLAPKISPRLSGISRLMDQDRQPTVCHSRLANARSNGVAHPKSPVTNDSANIGSRYISRWPFKLRRRDAKLIALVKQLADQLEDICQKATLLIQAIPKLAKVASAKELQQAFGLHLKETQCQVERLTTLFRLLDIKPCKQDSDVVVSFVATGHEAALMAAARRIEHSQSVVRDSLRSLAAVLIKLEDDRCE